MAAAEAAAAVQDEEDLPEGPTLPGQALINRAKANLGGFMLPGEGDRWVGVCEIVCVIKHGCVDIYMGLQLEGCRSC